ncbi:glucosyl transferase, partial [Neisseria meningitidis]|nr:glucosyl transferase [Neisseria meningitidis]
CGRTTLGYLHQKAQKTNPLHPLAQRRHRSNHATPKPIMAHSPIVPRRLVGLYRLPPERNQVAPPPPPQIRNASFHNPEKLPTCAPNTALPTMKPFSCSHRPATRAKVWNCLPTFSNIPACPSSSPLSAPRSPAL